jgi:cation diffusion facilitator CzcD-associated flavoprotein CzcO
MLQGLSTDPRRFPHHTEVRNYLEAYAQYFDLHKVVRLNTEVVSVTPTESLGPATTASGTTSQDGSDAPTSGEPRGWQVTRTAQPAEGVDSGATYVSGEYDAVMVFNGHYSVPRLPPVDGIDSFPGRCEHSHNYRRPEGYRGLKVLIVGAHASGASPAKCVPIAYAAHAVPQSIQLA